MPTPIILDYWSHQPLWLWNVFPLFQGRQYLLPSFFVASRLTAILLSICHDKMRIGLSTDEFLPCLGPMKQWILELFENMAPQRFALLIINLIPHSSVCGPLCAHSPLLFQCWMEHSLFESFFFFCGISVQENYQQCTKFSWSGNSMSRFNQFGFVLCFPAPFFSCDKVSSATKTLYCRVTPEERNTFRNRRPGN